MDRILVKTKKHHPRDVVNLKGAVTTGAPHNRIEKNRTVETTAEGGLDAPTGEHTISSGPKYDILNTGTSEVDPSLPNTVTNVTHMNQLVGRSKSGPQTPLNLLWGSSPPQTNRGIWTLISRGFNRIP